MRVGVGLTCPRLVALLPGHDAGDQREDQQRRHAGEPGPQAALGGAARAPAGLEEGPLGRLQLAAVLRRPVERRGQRRAAVEGAGLASFGVPDARGLAQVAVQAAAGDVLVEPAAQARPLTQECLVRDLDRAV